MNTIEIPGYSIEQQIGHGGMATVYLAIQESLDRPVALKVMEPVLAVDPTFGERFLKEAKTVARLSHPNILAIYDVGASGHHHYMAMEYLANGDLKASIRQGLDPTQALTILAQLASALAHAHKEGFVHRDIKPENVLFRGDGTVVLTDFGIAKAVGKSTNMTKTGMSIGTPHYMSPEQARGRTVDGRSDLYSLGVVFYEMLTGMVPYDAEDTIAVAYSHVNDPVPSLPSESAAYQPLIDLLMAKDPDHRFENADALVSAIYDVQQGAPISQPTAGATRVMHNIPDPVSQTAAMPSRRGETPPSSRQTAPSTASGLKWGVGGAVLALLIGAAVFYFNQSRISLPIGGGGGQVSVGGDRTPPQNTIAKQRPVERKPAQERTQHPVVSQPSVSRTTLHVVATPDNARIHVDGKDVGGSPYKSEVSAGKHTIKISAKGYYHQEKSVTVSSGQTSKVAIDLATWKPSKLFVATRPSNASVRLANSGKDYRQGISLEPGKHQIVVEAPNHKPKKQTVVLAGEVEKRITVTLTEYRKSKLYITTNAGNARIGFIDADMRYRRGIALSPGEYNLRIKAPGFASRRVRVTVKGDPKVNRNIALTPAVSDGLVAFFTFNGSSADAAGRGHKGQIVNGGYASDKYNRENGALRLNGSNAFVDCGSDSDFDVNRHTICAWIKHNGTSEKDMRIVGKVQPLEFESITFGLTSANKLMTNFATGSQVNHYLTGSDTIYQNRWYFVAMTYDGSYVRFYVDGVLDTRLSRHGTVRTNSEGLAIGKHGTPQVRGGHNRFFNGHLDDIRIYNRALSENEIKKIYNSY